MLINVFLHPELLVLDEPTVGVDPLLRESIWKYLVELSTERRTTILITTHFIDEAKDSTCIGVLRNGRLVAEQDPQVLLRRFNMTSLEDVVLQLCKQDDAESDNLNVATQSNTLGLENVKRKCANDEEEPLFDDIFVPPKDDMDTGVKIEESISRLKSLVQKNLVVLSRNVFFFLFGVVMPSLVVVMFCTTFSEPHSLDFGVVNYELSNGSCSELRTVANSKCDITNLGCRYIQNFPDGSLDLVYFQTEDEARMAVESGSIWGYMLFPQGYSKSFFARTAAAGGSRKRLYKLKLKSIQQYINSTTIFVKMDLSSNLNNEKIILTSHITRASVAMQIKKYLYDALKDFMRDLMADCGFDPRQGESPLRYNPPIIGSEDTPFANFVVVGAMISFLFYFPIVGAAVRLVNEKKQGTHERSLVSGARTWEILIACGVTECIALVLQTLCAYLTLIVGFQIEPKGSGILAFLLLLMCGLGGTSLGFLLGTIFNEEIEVSLIALTFLIPNLFLCGLIWPVEGQPVALQYISSILPCTAPGETMRTLFSRPFSNSSVWPGFAVLTVYILFFFFLAVVFPKVQPKLKKILLIVLEFFC